MVALGSFVAGIVFVGSGYADLVRLRSGSVLEGRVTAETPTDIELTVKSSSETGVSVLGLSKADILQIEREDIAGQKVVQVFPIPPKVRTPPITNSPPQFSAPPANTEPIQSSGAPTKSTITNLLREAESCAAQYDYAGAVKRTKSVFLISGAELSDLKQAQLIQSKIYADWRASLEEKASQLKSELSSLTEKISYLHEQVKSTQTRIDRERNGYYTYINGYERWVPPSAHRTMGGDSTVAMAQNDLRTMQSKMDGVRGSLSVIQAQISSVSTAQNQARLDAEDAIKGLERDLRAQLAKTVSESPPSTPKPAPPAPTPQASTSPNWWAEHWYFVVMGIMAALLIFRRN